MRRGSRLGGANENQQTQRAIVSDPDILGGTPIFRGSRVPVRALFENLADGQTLDAILDAFPTITREAAIMVLQHALALVEAEAVSESSSS
jgi:uncharacterized protein (DUF433 family)